MTENNAGSSVASVTVWPITNGVSVTWPNTTTFAPMMLPEVEEPGEAEDPEVEDPEDEMVEQAW